MTAVAVLPDGRVVTGGRDGRVLVWDPAEPGAGPVELGRHDRRVEAVAVLPDGRVVSGSSDRQILLWDAQSSSPGTSLACSVYALATFWNTPLYRSRSRRNVMLGDTPSATEHT